MNIEINNTTKSKINLALVHKVVEVFLKKYQKTKSEVSIAFVGDAKIKKLNKEYRGFDKVTDILSFDGEDNFLGELVIDYNQIKRQAKKFKHSIKYELIFILIHGLLHLIGYDDETEKRRVEMEKLGEGFMENAEF